MRIVCDNNVWYGIAEGTVTLDLETNQYYGTFINIVEFVADETKAKSPDDLKKLKAAIKNMQKFSSGIVFLDPLSYVGRYLYKSTFQDTRETDSEELYLKLIAYAEGKLPKLHGRTVDDFRRYKEEFQTGS